MWTCMYGGVGGRLEQTRLLLDLLVQFRYHKRQRKQLQRRGDNISGNR